MRKHLTNIGLAALLSISLCLAQTTTEKDHVMLNLSQIKFLPVAGALPAGAQIAVLDGNPAQPGASYTIALKVPDGYRVPPHWHPQEVSATVVQGTFGMGVGERFDPARGSELTPGSFMKLSKEVRHFEWSKGETIVFLHGQGPLDTTYVNPADDPRQKAAQK